MCVRSNRDETSLRDTLADLRGYLEAAFTSETAAEGLGGRGVSSGQCAAVSLVVMEELDTKVVSAYVDGISHWFNRIERESAVDIDLTGDQFGRPRVQVGKAGELYPETRERSISEADEETIDRAILLATRAGLDEAASSLSAELQHRNQCQ